MGLVDSPAVFHKMVAQILADCPGCEPYMDDIIVFGKTQEEHDSNLHKVFQNLNDKNLRLNIKKCIFRAAEVPFLGHLISNEGIKPDPKNLQPIRDAETPTTLKQVQSFLGMLNYYSPFLPDLAALTEPLRNLTRKDIKFVWSADCTKAFETLKKLVCTELKLAIFDSECLTYLSVDASDVGIGGVLSQEQHGREIPIAFGHHTLDARLRGMATNEREGYAAVFFTEYWEKFLLGRHFILRTDHQALTTLLTQYGDGRKSGKFARWYERLSVFDFTIEYRKGADNTVADALSRLSSKATELGVQDPMATHVIKAIDAQGLSMSLFQEASKMDPLHALLRTALTSHWPARNKLPAVLTPYFQLRNELTLDNDLIVRDDYRILVPESLRIRLLQMAHAGHPGIVRMKRKIRECYWWPGMDKEIEHFVRNCLPCQDSAKSAPKLHIEPYRIPLPDSPWEKLAIDITGPFDNAPHNMKFIVVLIDYYSKFPEILCTTDITSARIIKWLKEIFARYGNPIRLVSDNGPQFISSEFINFLHARDIEHERSPVYHPQHNGLVEVFNRYIKHGVQTFQASSTQWSDGLHDLLFHFRATSPTPDGKSPAELLFSRKLRMDFEIVRSQKEG